MIGWASTSAPLTVRSRSRVTLEKAGQLGDFDPLHSALKQMLRRNPPPPVPDRDNNLVDRAFLND